MFGLLNSHVYYSKTTGFVVLGNQSDSEMQKILLENENIETSYNSSESVLLIKNSEEVSGIVPKNKNKIIDFEVGRGKVRVYFDLMNYSKFVEDVVEQVGGLDNYVLENNPVSNSDNEGGVKNVSENLTTEIVSDSSGLNVSESNGLNRVAITGNVIDNEESLDNVKENIDDLNQTILDSIVENSVVNAENFDIVGSVLNGTEESKITGKSEEGFKWGYKVKLNDLKFMAKIDVTSNELISIYNNNTLKIGRNLMSFDDLEKQGYTVRFEKPSLGINVSINESSLENINVNESIANNTLENVTEVNQTEENITILINGTIGGNISDNIINESKDVVEENQTNNDNIINESNSIVNVTEPKTQNEREENIANNSNADNNNNNNGQEQTPVEENTPTENPTNTLVDTSTETSADVSENIPTESSTTGSDNYITGKAVVAFTGKVIGFEKNATIVEDVKYANTIVVYIERDFRIASSVSSETENLSIASQSSVANANNLNEQTIMGGSSDTGDIDFEDIDGDGKVSLGDVIELDPTLIIIPITDAEHLNNKREFISNVYESVRVKDNTWSEEIKNKEYLRIIFEKNLTKENDITIYARMASSLDKSKANSKFAEIEVYKQENDNLIAKFENISSENWYKVYLNNLSEGESFDVFDLRIIGNSVEFDYVVDPSAVGYINFTSPTLANGTNISNSSYVINVSIISNNISEIKYNWNGTNFTLYNDSLVLMMNFDNLSVFGEGSSNLTYDASNYSNNGTCQNMSAPGCNWTVGGGKYGKGISFDGSDDYVNATVIQTKTSHSLWYKNTTAIGWSFVAYNGSRFFINGAQGNPNQYPLNISGNEVKIGYNYTGNESFNGTIDEIRIWNYALSTSEVYQQYVSNLQKFNYTQWYLYVNQSKNASTGLDNGTYTYFASAKDSSGNENMTEVRSLTITSADTIYPTFSSYWDNNGSLINSGIGLFNVTLNNTNGTVFLEINNTNVSATNLTANVYNVSYNFTGNGTYNYKWISWGNGSNHLLNISDVRSYIVNNSVVSYPKLYLENILVCESSNLLHVFNVSDTSSIQSYSITPSDVFNIDYYDSINSTLKRYVLFSGNLTKAQAGGANNKSKNHSENVTMVNNQSNSNSSLINITVIEINNAPVMESISTQSVVAGNNFSKQLSVNDSENGNATSGNLSFNISFVDSALFNISSTGEINFTTNSSYIGNHNITVCAIDKGINAHVNISLCGQTGSNLSACRNFILNITSCGDSVCNNGETCSSCSGDCGACSTSSSGGGGEGA